MCRWRDLFGGCCLLWWLGGSLAGDDCTPDAWQWRGDEHLMQEVAAVGLAGCRILGGPTTSPLENAEQPLVLHGLGVSWPAVSDAGRRWTKAR